jgi:hypothetical protein
MLEISLGSTTIQNTGGGYPVMFINVLSNGKLEQISYDGDVVVGLNRKWQDAEDGLQPENELWYAYDWQSLIDIVGCQVTLDISRRVSRNWKPADNMANRHVVYGLENMIDMIDKVSMLDSTWSDNLECGYPFEKSFDDMLLDIFSWQQVVLSQEPPMYKRLRELLAANSIEFESRGQIIINPFFDENIQYAVDPIEYYGFDIIYAIAGKQHN